MQGLVPVTSDGGLAIQTSSGNVRVLGNALVQIGNAVANTVASIDTHTGQLTVGNVSLWSKDVIDSTGGWIGNPVHVIKGGTGQTSFADSALVLGNASGALRSTGNAITFSESPVALDLSENTKVRFGEFDMSIYNDYKRVIYSMPATKGDWYLVASAAGVVDTISSYRPYSTFGNGPNQSMLVSGAYAGNVEIVTGDEDSVTYFEGTSGSFVTKFDDDGLPQWIVRTTANHVQSLSSQLGPVYLLGTHDAGVQLYHANNQVFSMSLGAQSTKGIFVAKYSDAGAAQWIARIDGGDADFGASIDTQSTGNVFMTGYFKSATLGFYDAGATSPNATYSLTSSGGFNQLFVAKYSAGGSVLATSKVTATTDSGGVGTVYGECVQCVGDDALVSGNYKGTLSPNLGNIADTTYRIITSQDQTKGFVYKYDANLNGSSSESYRVYIGPNIDDTFRFKARRTISGSKVFGIGRTTQPRVRHTRTLPGTLYEKPTTYTTSPASFLLELSTLNNTYAYWIDGVAYDVATDASGNVFVCGSFKGSVSIGTTATPNIVSTTSNQNSSLETAFVAKFDPVSGPLWITRIECVSGNARAYQLTVDPATSEIDVGGFADASTIRLFNASGQLRRVFQGDSKQNFATRISNATGDVVFSRSLSHAFFSGDTECAYIRSSDGTFVFTKNVLLDTDVGKLGVGNVHPSAPVTVQTSSANDPMTNGVYVTCGDVLTDAIVGMCTSSGNAYVSYDVKNQGGWSVGVDSVDNTFKFSYDRASLTSNVRAVLDSVTGNLNVSGSLNQLASLSDARLKSNVTVIASALDKIQGLRGVHFDWRTKDANALGFYPPVTVNDTGLIAQEVQGVVPQAVTIAPRFNTATQEDYLLVRYEKLIPLMVQSIKELATQVAELRAEVATLKG